LLYWQTKKFSVRIFILPGPVIMYILYPFVCPGCTQIRFTCFGADKDLSDVAFSAGKNERRPNTFQTPENTILSLRRLTVPTKLLWHRA